MELLQEVSVTYFLLFFLFTAVAVWIDHVALKQDANPSLKTAMYWSLSWIGVALVFNAGFTWYWHHVEGLAVKEVFDKSLSFFTAWGVEKMLSVDNLFVFLMIFSAFGIVSEKQKQLLTIGVMGSVIMRTLMCFFGLWLLERFDWLLYVFGVALIWVGVEMWKHAKNEIKEESGIVKFIKSCQWVDMKREVFWLKSNVGWKLGAFGAAALAILLSDLLFALDSIPAVLAISKDPYIVVTTNVLAVLGLRALYFVLKEMQTRFSQLNSAVAVVLIFVGCKMLASGFVHMPAVLSLAVIICILTAGVVKSVKRVS